MNLCGSEVVPGVKLSGVKLSEAKLCGIEVAGVKLRVRSCGSEVAGREVSGHRALFICIFVLCKFDCKRRSTMCQTCMRFF